MPDQIVIHEENFWLSVVRDTYTFLIAFALIGAGVLLDSAAMQWMGFVLTALFLIAKASGLKSRAMKTPQEAANYLWDKYGVRSQA